MPRRRWVRWQAARRRGDAPGDTHRRVTLSRDAHTAGCRVRMSFECKSLQDNAAVPTHCSCMGRVGGDAQSYRDSKTREVGGNSAVERMHGLFTGRRVPARVRKKAWHSQAS